MLLWDFYLITEMTISSFFFYSLFITVKHFWNLVIGIIQSHHIFLYSRSPIFDLSFLIHAMQPSINWSFFSGSKLPGVSKVKSEKTYREKAEGTLSFIAQTDIRESRNGDVRAVVGGKAFPWQKAFSATVAGLSGFSFCGKDAYYRPSCRLPWPTEKY